MKDSFVLYASHLRLVEKLTDEQAGKLLKAIYQHTQGNDGVELDLATDLLYSIIAEQLDKDKVKYEEVVEKRRQAGIASAGKRSTKDNTTEQVSASVNTSSQVSTDNDNVYVNDNDKVKHIYGEYRHVKLTAAQYQDAVSKYGKEETDFIIAEIDSYCELHNKTYKNYREAINTFAKRGALDKFAPKNNELFIKSIRRLNSNV